MTDNNCATCTHKRNPQGGHCYMFREEPAGLCMQHQDRKPKLVGTIGHVHPTKAGLAATIVAVLAQQGKDVSGVGGTGE